MLDTYLLLLLLENGKKQGTKKRKQEANRPCKKSQFNQSIDSRLRANGFPDQGQLNISTHRARKDWKRSVTLQTSLYCRSLALIEDLSDQFEEREAIRREKPASKSGQVEASLPSSCSTASAELATSFSTLVATLATKLFPATTKYHYCSESFPTRPSRDENP